MEFKTITEPFDEKSIKYLNLFSNLLSENFEDTSELETLENWIDHSPRYTITCILVLENDVVIGGILFEKYKESGCYLCTYLCVSSQIRGEGLSRKLVEKMLSMIDGTVFAECRNPLKLKTASPKDMTRLIILSKLGAYKIDYSYFQPPLKGHDEGCDHLMLLTFSKENIDPHVLFGFLSDFYKSLDYTIPVCAL